jgi:hypothetical protein
MNKLQRQRLTFTCLTLLTVGIPAVAQEKPEPAKLSKTMTLTGCLNKGERPQHYTFTDLKTGRKMTVTGPADLEKHSGNHTVKITGARTGDVFDVTKVEHVSPTCEAKSAK